MEDAHKLFKIPKSECPDVWMRLPRHKWPKSWEHFEDPVVPLERHLYGHPLAGLLWETQFEDVLLELGWEKSTQLGMSVCSSETRVIFKITKKKQNMAPMWKKLMKLVDLGEPTSFLAHVYLGCTQRECKPNETIIAQYTKMFESRFSAGATEKLPGWEKSRTNSSVVLRHGRTCSKMR